MKYTKAQITEKNADEFTAVASTEDRDRHGDIVKSDGWDVKDFKQNPILLFMHDHTKPIGKATRVWVDKAKKQLMFKGVITTATEAARGAKQLMEDGILNSFSVGFMPLEMDGNVITKSELHEISLVSVPANSKARLVATKSLQKAGISEETIKELVPEENLSEREKELSAAVDNLTKELAATKEIAETAVKGLRHLAPQRSKHQVATERLRYSKVIAKASDKLMSKDVSREKAARNAKIIKLSSEKLIRSFKGDL